jgi:hypothetical protein
MDYITCAFINSDKPPVREEKLEGMFVEEQSIGLGKFVLRLYNFVFVSYPHPSAPEDAFLQVLERRLVKEVRPEQRDYPALYMLLQAQNNVKNNVEIE